MKDKPIDLLAYNTIELLFRKFRDPKSLRQLRDRAIKKIQKTRAPQNRLLHFPPLGAQPKSTTEATKTSIGHVLAWPHLAEIRPALQTTQQGSPRGRGRLHCQRSKNDGGGESMPCIEGY